MVVKITKSSVLWPDMSMIESVPLFSLFQPKSIAVVGASTEPTKVGHLVLKNILAAKFPGNVYPVNPKVPELLSLPCFASVSELPETPDVVIIVVPASVVLEVVTACGEKGVPNVVVISAGFKETGSKGAELEQQLSALAKKYQLRILGPNCLGIINPGAQFNGSFAADLPQAGQIGLISQSGAIGTALLDMSVADPTFGISWFISVGNKVDLTETDILKYAQTDSRTKVVLSYCESLTDPVPFLETADVVSRTLPIVMLKSGTSEAGQAAAASHTGSLSGSDSTYSAALKKAGVIRVSTMEELCALGSLFACLPKAMGRRLAIVTNAGGPGVLATDAVALSDLTLATLSDTTTEALKAALPESANWHNPVDVLGNATSDRYQAAITAVAQDPGVDAILVILTPQAMTEIDKTATVIKQITQQTAKPIVCSFIGEFRTTPGIEQLRKALIPTLAFPEQAVKSLATFIHYFENRETRQPLQLPKSELTQEKPALRKLPTTEFMKLCQEYQIATIPTLVAHDLATTLEKAENCHYPVVLKLEHPELIHKTEFKAVHVGLESAEAVTTAWNQLATQAQTQGWKDAAYVVQPMVSSELELIAGFHRDPVFGPIVTFGLGGILVEALRDVVSELVPITPNQAADMVKAIRAHQALEGFRGLPAINFEDITNILCGLSTLAIEHPEISECDCNPLLVTGEHVVAVDVRMMKMI